MKYNKVEEMQRIVEHVEGVKENDGWIILTTRGTADLMGWSQAFATTMLSELKNNNNIEHREYEGVFKGGKRPYEFRMKRQNKEEKQPMSKEYKNLTESQVTEAISLFQSYNISKNDHEDMLRVLNTYHSPVCNKDNLLNDVCDLLIIDEEKVSTIISALTIIGLIKESIDEKEIETIEEYVSDTVIEQEEQQLIITETTKIEELKIDTLESSVQNNELVSNLKGFASMQQDFVDYLKGAIGSIEGTNSKEEVDELKHQLEGCNNLVDKYIKNENVLNDTIDALKEELRIEKKVVAAHKEKTENLILNMEQRLEVTIAEIMNEVSAYSKIPSWQRDTVTNARMQNAILDAIKTAVGDILAYNKTSGKEN